MLSEDELIEGCLKGDRKAQQQLYDKYSGVMFAVCLRYMPTTQDAEDALVTGFTTIFSKLDTFERKGSLEGWMKKLMVHNAISLIRKNAKFFCQDDEDLEHLNDEQPDIISRISAQEIIQLIQTLPDGYRSVFNLYAIEGYSYEEIAQMLNVNIGTVRSQLSKARKTLKEKIKRQIDGK